ncbi:MAG: YbhB/YbcL family Raf kinase inhibitor-like protein [Xanthobacteraceae bacterium]|nr:YbhB/YbcL family Raf kinase inhibitor-like protein [Xanthobacteraceae bacterium]MBV9631257.1 YbhB/YbcL family Raf kinase inhibitor-like protein [Xanthobacteraceae bacterium]
MPALRHIGCLAFSSCVLWGAASIAGGVAAAEPFQITSSSFKDGTVLDKKYVGNNKSNPNCVGENVSPALSWSNPPPDTKSFAIMVIDPEGRAPAGVAHWVAYGIPASVTGFAEGEVSGPSEKYVGGKSTMNLPNYFGPCTPAGVGFHHYTFILMATDLDPKALAPGMTREELTQALNGHVKGSTGMIGMFGRSE